MIEIYNTRLTERERRRQFVMDRKLINVRKQQNLDRRRNPTERALYARLKAVARYLPQQEFEVLSEGIVTESRLRARIQVSYRIHELLLSHAEKGINLAFFGATLLGLGQLCPALHADIPKGMSEQVANYCPAVATLSYSQEPWRSLMSDHYAFACIALTHTQPKAVHVNDIAAASYQRYRVFVDGTATLHEGSQLRAQHLIPYLMPTLFIQHRVHSDIPGPCAMQKG